MTNREALISMQYRECEPGKWFKPVGLHLFTFYEKTNTWTNFYKHNEKDEVLIYDSQTLQNDMHFLNNLKSCEAWTRINIPGWAKASFELSAIDL